MGVGAECHYRRGNSVAMAASSNGRIDWGKGEGGGAARRHLVGLLDGANIWRALGGFVITGGREYTKR